MKKNRPSGLIYKRKDPFERFMQKVNKTARCWEWTAAKGRGGYPIFSVGRKAVRAHRWSYEQFKGAIPPEMTVDHMCNNILCVNPFHLQLLSHSDNVKRKGSAPLL